MINRILTIFLVVTLLSSCDDAKKVGNTSNLKIVCTTGMIADAVQNIVGKEAQVVGLMGPGVDPHLYKATQGDLKDLSSADVIIYNGLHLEGKMGEIFEKLGKTKKIIVAANGVDRSKLIKSSDYPGAYDPHLWFDVSLWNEVAIYLGDQLSQIEGLDKAIIKRNTEQYSQQLDSLNSWTFSQIQKVDSSKRVLITAHDAFGYFGKAYNIEVKGLQGISTLSEYGLKDVSDLVNFIVQRQIQAVFVESSVSDRALKAVAEGCRKKGHPIKIGGTLYSDAMGEKGTEEGSYLGMVSYNVNTIVEALQ